MVSDVRLIDANALRPQNRHLIHDPATQRRRATKHGYYHKGMRESSVLSDDLLEINDFIIDQSGRLMYDWDQTDMELLEKIMRQARTFVFAPNAHISNEMIMKEVSQFAFSCGSGSGRGCGGSGC